MDIMKKIAVVLLMIVFLYGCVEPEWDVFTNEKFSMSYPVGDMQQTEGDQVFLTLSEGCQISVSKFEDQPSFSAFVNYIKDTWEDAQGLTIESEYIGSSVADFEVRASDEEVQYKGSLEIRACGEDTIYVVMVGCGRNVYDNKKEMVDRIIDSIECS